MSDKVVTIYNDEPRVGTFKIAKGFDREHKIVLNLLNKYKEDFLDFGTLKMRKSKSTGGRPVEEYILNEQQALLLGSYFRNSQIVRVFKKRLIKEFERLKKVVELLEPEKSNSKYLLAREEVKQIRKETTDQMKEFVDYAKVQGSKTPEKYYTNITRMINGLLFIVDGKFKNLRNVMTTRQLMVVGAAEGIVDKGLKDGMKKGIFYKQIYQDIKSNVMTFAELHGQSHVIEEQLKLES